MKAHTERMRELHGHGLNDKQHGAVYNKAYELGHRDGESEIELHYIDLADLVRDVLKYQSK